VLRSAPLRVLDDSDFAEVLALLDSDPVVNVLIAARVQAAGLDPWRLGAEVWGYGEAGRLSALCHAGANLAPTRCPEAAIRAFAEKARRQGRRCSSIVGPAETVQPLWEALRRSWGPARDVRQYQPLMTICGPSPTPLDPLVRRVQPDELDLLVPACVAMFTEEVGVSPIGGDGGALYRSRIAELIAAGRSFARIERGRVIFKAEIGSATQRACQIQGVWVDPGRRGEALSVAGMAAVVALAQESAAPVVSLYVNDYNVPARRAYERVGFREIGAFSSVLF
jgi:predicted GNAT family acetyltransferase